MFYHAPIDVYTQHKKLAAHKLAMATAAPPMRAPMAMAAVWAGAAAPALDVTFASSD